MPQRFCAEQHFCHGVLFGHRPSEACSQQEECPWKHSALHLPEYTGAEPAFTDETGNDFGHTTLKRVHVIK